MFSVGGGFGEAGVERVDPLFFRYLDSIVSCFVGRLGGGVGGPLDGEMHAAVVCPCEFLDMGVFYSVSG